MISYDEAVELVRSVAIPIGTERVPVSEAAGRVLAAPVVAAIDSPRSDVSMMDGYAVRGEDVEDSPAGLAVAGESFAGRGWDRPLGAGTCVRIFTGARVPSGADRVVIQEHVRRDGDRAIITEPLGMDRYIRSRGSDFQAGDELLPVGRFLDPRAIVAAAAADVGELEVNCRPRLVVFSTGDELAEPGTARAAAEAVPDSLSAGIAALASQWGAAVIARKRMRDDLLVMQRAAEAATSEADLLVVTGGASVGEKDLARTMFAPVGLQLVFSNLSIKPGRPAWLGRARGKLVIGLPGNPTSAVVTARLLLAPLLSGMTGQPIDRALAWRTERLGTPLPPAGGRETFHRARMGRRGAEILSSQDSGAQKALAEADVLVRQPANGPALEGGDLVPILDF